MSGRKPTGRPTGRPLIDETGKRYGRLLVLHATMGKEQKSWLCQCDCGNTTIVRGSLLRSGDTTSCGCRNYENMKNMHMKHGERADGGETPEYRAWCAMIIRCENPNGKHWQNYGGRGISVSPRWRHSYDTFLADMGRRPSARHSLDRIDVDGNYEPGNCRWATQSEQCRNWRRNRHFNAITAMQIAWLRTDGGFRLADVAAGFDTSTFTALSIAKGRHWSCAIPLPRDGSYQGEVVQ